MKMEGKKQWEEKSVEEVEGGNNSHFLVSLNSLAQDELVVETRAQGRLNHLQLQLVVPVHVIVLMD